MNIPARVTIRKEWFELIAACRNVAERRQLAFALLERLFAGTPALLPEHLQPLFSAIEREIMLSEKNRRNIEKRWGTVQFGMIPSTIPSTIRRTEPSTVPSTIRRTEPAPAHPKTAPAHDSNNTTRELENNNIINNKLKENRDKSLQKKSSLYPVLPGLTGEYCDAFPQDYQSKWDEWEKYYRERNRRKMPPTTAYRQIKKLICYTPEEAALIIDFSIERGYQGLFYEKALPGHQPVVLQKSGKDFTGI